jgi:hypothetical protein
MNRINTGVILSLACDGGVYKARNTLLKQLSNSNCIRINKNKPSIKYSIITMQPTTVLSFLGLVAFVLASPVANPDTFAPRSPEALGLTGTAPSLLSLPTNLNQTQKK